MRNRILTVIGVVFVVGLVLYFLGIRMPQSELRRFISAAPEPLACLGGVREGAHCASGIPFTNSLLMTIIVDLLLVALAFFGLRNMQLIPRGIQNIIEIAVEGFYNFAQGIDRANVKKFFPVPATIFFFFLVANLLALVPGIGSIGQCVSEGEEHALYAPSAGSTTLFVSAPLQEGGEAVADEGFFTGFPFYCPQSNALIPYLRAPAADLNVTFAFALVAVFLVEYFGVQALGLSYFTRFINLKEGALGFFVGLIEIISEISRIVSFAFRIFGNIFGGEVILAVMAFLFPFILPLPFYGFEVFVALIQAFIFAVLTLVFMSNAVVAHGSHDDHEAHPEHGSGELIPEVQGTH